MPKVLIKKNQKKQQRTLLKTLVPTKRVSTPTENTRKSYTGLDIPAVAALLKALLFLGRIVWK